MKLKQTVLIMMAAALPLTSMAAASETIPVTKDTGAVVARLRQSKTKNYVP